MSPEVKNVLESLVDIKKRNEILENAYENMEIKDVFNVIERILFWNRAVFSDEGDYDQYFENEYILLGKQIERTSEVFKYAPELSKVFSFQRDRVKYNDELEKEEINEIREYIYNRRRVKRFIFPPKIRKPK